jgi:hypothetical protein
LIAADVNGLNGVDSVDVIAIQRFYLRYQTRIANIGKYRFSPLSQTYAVVTGDQIGQNYDPLIFGDIASPFAE